MTAQTNSPLKEDSKDSNELDRILNCNCGGNDILNGSHYDDCAKNLKPKLHHYLKQRIVNEYLDQCFPMSDHDEIRKGNYTGGGYISEDIILDRIAELTKENSNG
jgi:hypothetical protein